ncbi:MAG: hypothetical protein ACOC33_03825 [bacterium]
MSRPKRPKMLEIKDLINEEINNYIFEIFDKQIPTDYEKIKNNKYRDIIFDIYRFKSNSGNSYDVDFYYSDLNINDKPKLKEHFNSDSIETVDIGFTLTNYNTRDIDNDDIIGGEDDPYNKRSEYNEQYEVLGKIAYIINDFVIEHNNIDAYVIGKDSHHKKLKAYLQMFKNIFSNKFMLIDEESPNYDNGAYYFIKKL